MLFKLLLTLCVNLSNEEIDFTRLNSTKCSKISNNFLSLLSNKILVFKHGICKMDVKIANSEDPDQTASLEAV